MAPLRRGDRKLHRLTAASPLGRQFALMGKMETWRQREDESGRRLGNRKCASPEGTDDQEREKDRGGKIEMSGVEDSWKLYVFVGGGTQTK